MSDRSRLRPGTGSTRPARAVLAGLVLLACSLGPPDAPELAGPVTGQPGDTLWFVAVAPGARAAVLSLRFDWGDNTTSAWGPLHPAGEEFRHWHSYAQPGEFEVRAQALNSRGQESGWSEPLHVVVGFAGPLVPVASLVPGSCFPDTNCEFGAVAGHVRGESVACEFAWSDSVSLRSGFVSAGTEARIARRFGRAGRFGVRVRAIDAAGNTSPWSLAESTTVTPWPLAAPRGLQLSAYSGIFVRLTWGTGRNPDSTRYGIWFRGTGNVEFSRVDEVTGESYVHDPAGFTGEYTVSARYGGEELFAAETLSTAPAYTDTVVLGELNTLRDAGFGWDRQSGLGRVVSMRDSASSASADIYFTDFTPGWSGPIYYLASAALGPGDAGGVVPPGPWRATKLLGLVSGGQEPVPGYDSLLYQNAVDVSSFVSYSAVYLPEGYYALVRATDPSTNDGTVRLVAWFQRVRGLRLVQHVLARPGAGH